MRRSSRRALEVLFLSVVTVYLFSCGRAVQGTASEEKLATKIRAVVVTGGHGFDRKAFFEMFNGLDGIEYVESRQQQSTEIFDDISDWRYDVIVLYNMTQNISAGQRDNFIKLLQRGVGLVALHHSIGAYGHWPEYQKIIGGRYYLKAVEQGGVRHQASTYKHDIDIKVHIEDKSHPICKGLSDFVINDEAYKGCVFEKDNHVLLRTDHPDSDGPLCWVRRYGRARVCYLQLGHGPSAYSNENYRRLVSEAIKWAAGRDK